MWPNTVHDVGSVAVEDDDDVGDWPGVIDVNGVGDVAVDDDVGHGG